MRSAARGPMPIALPLLAALIWSLLPLLWQLLTSLRTPEALVLQGPAAWLQGWTLANYRQVLQGDPPFWRYLLNSSLVGAASTGLTLLLAIPAAYGLQRQRPALRGGISLLLRAAFADLPAELEDAARLEGLNLWQRLHRVLLPLLAPAVASTAILVFLFSWNEYPIALTWISRNDLLTLPVAMARIAGSSVYAVPYGAFAAATVLGGLPLLALVLVFQRQIVSGLTQGAVKG